MGTLSSVFVCLFEGSIQGNLGVGIKAWSWGCLPDSKVPTVAMISVENVCKLSMVSRTWENHHCEKHGNTQISPTLTSLVSYERCWPLACLEDLLKPNQASHQGAR
jgi:hypothetical protein